MPALTSAADKAMVKSIPIPEAAVNAILGYGVVFFGLILLMCVVIIMGKVMVSRQTNTHTQAPSEVPASPAPAPAPAVPVVAAEPAPGSAGEVKLFDVPDKDAAMIMAIVSNNMGKPLNELRFKSIKEVK